MYICFNFLNVGLGNNGGTRTILKCGETLIKLGHKVDFVSTIDQHTWLKHKPIIKKIPTNADVLIATGCNSVDSTSKSDVPKKCWFIRGHESWATSEKNLIKCYKKNLINVVNSNGLKKKLKSYGVDSSVVYQGIDFELWENLKLRETNNKIRIGCLYNPRHKTKHWDHFQYIAKRLDKKKYEFVGFGAIKSKDDFLSDFITNPTEKDLRNFYNTCHIWFAPTISEGLHNPPMEAALCGCLIVCNNNEDNGMVLDYAFKDKTAMVYNDMEEAVEMISHPKWEFIDDMSVFLKTHINTREYNMKKMCEIINT
jgi:hypothetical protein